MAFADSPRDWSATGRSDEPDGAAPLVSIIVPVRDNPEGVRALIACLAAQTLSPDRFEVVISDDGSHPDLVPVIPDAHDHIRVIRAPRQLSYAARNRGARAARGQILAFCDSDCLPQPQWLHEALRVLENADVVAGEVKFQPPPSPTIWSLLTIDMFLDQERNVTMSRGVTANLVVRRELFDALGGFDETLPSGGDYDFVERAVRHGARLRYALRAVVCHPTLNRARPFLRKVWFTNHWSGVRRALRGDRMDLWGALVFVPIYGVVQARHHALRPAFSLYRPRIRAAGVNVSWRDDVRALPLLYFVVSYVAGVGRTIGWMRGRRMLTVVRGSATAAQEPGTS